jgi:hypothetical protein
MDKHTILQLIEIFIAAMAIGYGVFEHYKRQKMEKILKTITQTFPGDVAKIQQSCAWASTNVRNAHKEGLKIPDSPEKHNVLTFINNATADAAASARMCSNLFNQLLVFSKPSLAQEILFIPKKKASNYARKK